VFPNILMLGVAGLKHFLWSPQLLTAALTSVLIAAPAASLAVLLSLGLGRLQALRPEFAGWTAALSLAGFIVPPAVLATGWFLALRNVQLGWSGSLLVIAALNGLMALPFSTALLTPAMARCHAAHHRLSAQLGLDGWTRFATADLPILRPVLAQSFILAFVMSFGDLAAVTLLGSNGVTTLPSLVASQMGHFQSNAAMGTALLLALLCLMGGIIAQRVGGHR
jgi:thiamine transport system permease protein